MKPKLPGKIYLTALFIYFFSFFLLFFIRLNIIIENR